MLDSRQRRPRGKIFLPTRKGAALDRDYDLFEVLPDGALIWRETVPGHQNAIKRLVELSKQTSNEVRVMHVLSKTLIASLNKPKT
jgi:hypothetical protein